MKLAPFLLFAGLMANASAADPPSRVELTSKDGRTIEVEVVSVGESSAKIRKADGKEFDIAFDRLKPESVDLLKKSATPPAAAPEAEARPLPKTKPASPADLPEKVVVKSGETVLVAFTEVKSGLTKPVVVKEIEKEAPRFSVEFKVREPKDEITMATVAQTYEKTLTVRCLARNKGQKKYYPTSILPLQKGLPCLESWGDDVEELVFYDFAWAEDEENK